MQTLRDRQISSYQLRSRPQNQLWLLSSFLGRKCADEAAQRQSCSLPIDQTFRLGIGFLLDRKDLVHIPGVEQVEIANLGLNRRFVLAALDNRRRIAIRLRVAKLQGFGRPLDVVDLRPAAGKGGEIEVEDGLPGDLVDDPVFRAAVVGGPVAVDRGRFVDGAEDAGEVSFPHPFVRHHDVPVRKEGLELVDNGLPDILSRDFRDFLVQMPHLFDLAKIALLC